MMNSFCSLLCKWTLYTVYKVEYIFIPFSQISESDNDTVTCKDLFRSVYLFKFNDLVLPVRHFVSSQVLRIVVMRWYAVSFTRRELARFPLFLPGGN